TRARGMGSAYTAISDDLGAMTYNTAGLAFVDWYEFQGMYSKLYYGLDEVDLDLGYAGTAFKVSQRSSVGVDWSQFRALNQYVENVIRLGYGYKISKITAFGIQAGYLKHGYTLDEYTKDDSVFAEGTSATGMGISLGFLARWSAFSFGLSAKNINSPDVGLESKDIVPAEYRAGVAIKTDNISIPFDVSYRDQKWGSDTDKMKLYYGLEIWFNNKTIAFRAGGSDNEITGGFSVYVLPNKYKHIDLGIDYAFVWPLTIIESNGSHQLSFVVRYGKPRKTKKIKKIGKKSKFTNTVQGLNPRINVKKSVSSQGEVGEVLIDNISVMRLYAKVDKLSSYSRAVKFSRDLSKIMNEGIFTFADISYVLKEEVYYIVIKEQLLLKVNEDAKLLGEDAKSLSEKWITNLQTILID
ncbi:type IX secretion system membrane protein PorP/SprF, partial [bacterium]